MPLSIGRLRWVRLLLVAVVVYLVLLPLWYQSLEFLAWAAGNSAGLVYRMFDSLVTIRPDEMVIVVAATATEQSGFGGQVHSLSLKIDTITYGLPMLMALILVTKADSLLMKLRSLLIGLVVMGVLTLLAVMFWAKMTSLQLDDRVALSAGTGAGNQSGFFYYAFHGYAFSQPVVAVGIWLALVMLGLFKSRPKEGGAAVTAVRRNAPCPCGSGRKYKRCCGAAR